MGDKITIIQDTREQRGWFDLFDSERFDVRIATLQTGDYTLAGLDDRIAVERKSLGDAVGTFIHQWTRFRHELNRLACFDLAIVVIESDIGDVLNHRYESDAEPAAVLGRINSITIDHNIPVCFWGQRPSCVTMVERFLLQAHKKLRGGA
jgi:DNA excision repair protein ERCC-4